MLGLISLAGKAKNVIPWVLLGLTFIVLSTVYYLLNREKDNNFKLHSKLAESQQIVETQKKEIERVNDEIVKIEQVNNAYQETLSETQQQLDKAHLDHMKIKDDLDQSENEILANPENYEVIRIANSTPSDQTVNIEDVASTSSPFQFKEPQSNPNQSTAVETKVLKKDAAKKVSRNRSSAMWDSYC